MTFIEFMKKLNKIKDTNNVAETFEIHFFAEDDYNTIDVKIENIEIEDNKIFFKLNIFYDK